jgi:hypothetical protein
LRTHHLDDVAAHDVFLGALHVREKFFLRHVRFESGTGGASFGAVTGVYCVGCSSKLTRRSISAVAFS